MDRQEVERLWRRYRKERAIEDRNRLVEVYRPLVERIAWKLTRTLPNDVLATGDDLISEGTLGLMQAIEGFDPARNTQFQTYATLRIRGAMVDGLRVLDWVPRLERRREKQGLATPLALGSLDEAVYTTDAGEPVPRGALLEDRAAPAAESRLLAADTWRELLRGLGQRERLLLILYYGEGLTLREAGVHIGVSESRASQMLAQALRWIRAQHPQDGPNRGAAAPRRSIVIDSALQMQTAVKEHKWQTHQRPFAPEPETQPDDEAVLELGDDPQCIVCGCTDVFGCDGGCWWVGGPGAVDLCSGCTLIEPTCVVYRDGRKHYAVLIAWHCGERTPVVFSGRSQAELGRKLEQALEGTHVAIWDDGTVEQGG